MKKKSPALFLSVLLLTFVADQITKYAVVANIPWEAGNPTYLFSGQTQPVPVIENFLYIVHITNEGAAWGILSGQTYLLASIAILALAAMWFFRAYLGFSTKLGQTTMGLFAGGVLGNLFDRVHYGHVIDFIDVHLPIIGYRWPAFNVADCGICIGVVIYILSIIFEKTGEDAPIAK